MKLIAFFMPPTYSRKFKSSKLEVQVIDLLFFDWLNIALFC